MESGRERERRCSDQLVSRAAHRRATTMKKNNQPQTMHEHNKHKYASKIRMHVSNECENERNRNSKGKRLQARRVVGRAIQDRVQKKEIE